MKKVYQKPELFYESFALMSAIAGCSVKVASTDPNTCAWVEDDFGGIPVFNVGINPDCLMDLESIHVGITIGSPTVDGTVFGS